MSPKKMPKVSKISGKPVKKIEDFEEDTEKLEDSDILSSSSISDVESVPSEVEEVEEIEEVISSEEEEGYIETESEAETDLKEGDYKLEEECDYVLDEHLIVPDSTPKERLERSTKPALSYYERVLVLSVRAKQISVGAKVYIAGVEEKSPLEIAQLELEQGLIPFIIKRPFPDNTYEKWKLAELSIE